MDMESSALGAHAKGGKSEKILSARSRMTLRLGRLIQQLRHLSMPAKGQRRGSGNAALCMQYLRPTQQCR
ncbi:MAG: hypothetical protein V4858_29725 [Pseudomonadota bacterium]